MNNSLSDDMLMKRIHKGDEEAYGILHRRHSRWLHVYMRAFARCKEDEEELVQDIMTKIHRSATTYTSNTSFYGWVKAIATNTGNDYLRKQYRDTRGNLGTVEFQDWMNGDLRYEPSRRMGSESLRPELRKVIDSLSEKTRLIIVMRYFGNLSIEEISWAMRCPLDTVKSRIHNGLKKVREELANRKNNTTVKRGDYDGRQDHSQNR